MALRVLHQHPAPVWFARFAPFFAIGGGFAAWGAINLFGSATPWIGPALTLTAGVVAVAYLGTLVVKGFTSRGSRNSKSFTGVAAG
jgi:membrane protein YqaA with SNARE-associated domain